MRVLSIVAFANAALVYPIAWILDAQAVEAWQIAPFAPEIVEMNKVLDAPSPSDPDYRRKVAGLYGNAIGEPDRFLFVPDEKFLHPDELPELRLLPVDEQAGEDPLQARTVFFFAPWFAADGAALLGIWWIRRRRALREEPEPLY